MIHSFQERPRWQRISVWTAALVVAGVYLYAAYPKLLDPAYFARAIRNFRLFDDEITEWTAILLPPIEAVTSLALFVPKLRRGAAMVAGGMLVAFIAAVSSALLRGLDIECGCFGSNSAAQADIFSILRNVFLLFCCLLIVRWGQSHNTEQ